MTEGDLPERYKPKEKKEKLVTKKRWDEMTAEYIDILKNGSEMDPKEAFRRIKQIDMSVNPYVSKEKRNRSHVVKALEMELLRREGLDPDEWIKYTDAQPKAGWNTPFTEEDMERVGAGLPNGLELFVLPGSVSSGSEHLEADYKQIDHFWSVYVRIKQDPSLSPPSPQLLSASEESSS